MSSLRNLSKHQSLVFACEKWQNCVAFVMVPFLVLETMQIHTKKVKNIYTSLLNALKFIVQINFTGRCCDNCNCNFVIPRRYHGCISVLRRDISVLKVLPDIPDDSESDPESDPKEKEDIPVSYLCPITQELMRDPYVDADGEKTTENFYY